MDRGQPLGLVGVEHHLARRRAGRGRQADGHHVALAGRIDGRVQKLVEGGGFHLHHRLFLGDHALFGEIDGDLQRRLGRALPVARLQHVQTALLDRELDVLHVAVVALQPLHHVLELLEHLRQRLFHGGLLVAHFLAGDPGQGLGRADAGHHVLALGVDQELAIEARLARRRIAGEGHAGGRGLAHVAEDHGLDVHRRAPALGDVVHAAIELGPVVHPAGEHRADGAPQLRLGVLREVRAEFAGHGLLVVGDDLLPVLGRERGVDGDVQALLMLVEDLLEHVVVEVEHHVRIHLDETAIGIEGEAAVARQLGQPLHRFVVQAEIEDGVHHARHGGARAGASCRSVPRRGRAPPRPGRSGRSGTSGRWRNSARSTRW